MHCAWLDLWAFMQTKEPHKAGQQTPNSELDRSACKWMRESLQNLLVVAAKGGRCNVAMPVRYACPGSIRYISVLTDTGILNLHVEVDVGSIPGNE